MARHWTCICTRNVSQRQFPGELTAAWKAGSQRRRRSRLVHRVMWARRPFEYRRYSRRAPSKSNKSSRCRQQARPLPLAMTLAPQRSPRVSTLPHALSDPSFVDRADHLRFAELHQDFHSVLSAGIAQLGSSNTTPHSSPRSESDGNHARQFEQAGYDFSQVSVPKQRLIKYLTNWITDCAPLLDKFDVKQSFATEVPMIARSSPPLLYAILAFSARQWERRHGSIDCADSLELYQAAISLLAPILDTKDRNVPVIVCILACLELMSGRAQDWRRHVEGCAALFEIYKVSGFCGGLGQAVFWCFARMDLCGSIMSEGSQTTVFQLRYWAPAPYRSPDAVQQDKSVDDLFHQQSRDSPDMHANWMVYLSARVCDLSYRRTLLLETGHANDQDARPIDQRWTALWRSLQRWRDSRCPQMIPIEGESAPGKSGFPSILFTRWPAISANQLYHTSCIIMLEMQPNRPNLYSERNLKPLWSPQWHARRVCGISLTNQHSASLVNAIQPLYVAGRILSHPNEHVAIARILATIESTTGWGAIWRLADLEKAWGYESGEILQTFSGDLAHQTAS